MASPETSADRYIGLMSGTSLDGADAVLVDFSAGMPSILASCQLPYSPSIRAQALALQRAGHNELHLAALLGNQLAHVYARAALDVVEQAGLASQDIVAIGCHGQTLRHRPQDGYTLQIGNPALLAEQTGISVVTDFRSRDIAAGGQGAPLVPAFHDALFRKTNSHRIILNLGGIANITNLAPGKPTTGFDCGPANMLIDAWAEKNIAVPMDSNGEWALTGNVIPELLNSLLADSYFDAPPPKSCGREQFGIDWLFKSLTGNERPQDVQATLVKLTAQTISQAIAKWCGTPNEVFACGGGVNNGALMNSLRSLLPSANLNTTDMLGVPAHLVESIAFAWLARCFTRGEAGNLPAVTGAKGPRILGANYPAT